MKSRWRVLLAFAAIGCTGLWPGHAQAQETREFNFDGPLQSKRIGNISWPSPWQYQRASLGGKVELEIEPDPELDGRNVAHFQARLSSFLIYLDLRKEPLVIGPKQKLTWQWKATALPKGGDAHDEHRNDQALQVYLAFEKEGGYDVLGYVWDNQQAENDDSVIRHTYRTALYGRVDAATLVVRRGASEEWVRQTRNLAADYRKYFGGESPKLVAAGIWCDSDQTNSFAEGYMGPLRLGD